MPHPLKARLEKQLPPQVAAAFARAAATENYRLQEEHVTAAFGGVGFPQGRVSARPAELTAPQRALAELSAYVERLGLYPFALPDSALVRRRWLGLEPGGALEEELDFEHRGAPRRGPLWWALQLAVHDDGPGLAGFLRTLPLERRLRAWCALFLEGNGVYGLVGSILDAHALGWDALRGEGRDWLPAEADRLVRLEGAPAVARFPVFLGLVRAGLEIEPRWDPLLVVREWPEALVEECIAALPAERRAAAILASLGRDHPTYAFNASFELLARHPSEALARWVVAAGKARQEPAPAVLARLAPIARAHAAVRAVVEDARAALVPLPALRVGRLLAPTSAARLAPHQRRQLEAIGRDGEFGKRRKTAEELLAPGVYEETGTLRGLVELCVLEDEERRPAYEWWSTLGDSGTVFRAGTLDVVATVIQDGLECEDAALRDALTLARAKQTRGPSKKRAVQKRGVKRPGAKKPGAKKPKRR